jgi:Secretion system C-terminal sorting domain
MKRIYSILFPVFLLAASCLLLNSCSQKNNAETEKENDLYDGPDKAAEFEFKRTKNPFTGKVDRQKMWEAVMQTTQLKNQVPASQNSTAALNWVERGSNTDAVGPSNGNTRPGNGVTSGRIRAVWVDLADATGKTVWVAGVDGGVWKTTDITAATPNWALVNDFLSNLAVSGICQDPTNTNIMYFCTGESYFNGDAVFGNGVFKSTDHGVTWTQLANTANLTKCSKILCDAAGNVYVSTIGIGIAVGLQRSSDKGATWVSINPFTTTSRIVDFEISSTGTMHVSAGLSSAAGIGGYRYNTNPATATTSNWSSATTLFAFPAGNNSRTELACVGNTVYASLGLSSSKIEAIAKSTDGGDNWTTTTLTATNISDLNGGGQGWYAQALAVDPSNPNNIIVGSLNLIKSTDGGVTFNKISEWVGTTGQYVHADQHNFTWYDNGNKMLVGCDGGLFYTADKGATFSHKNTGLRLKQFYSVAVHPTSTNYFLAGAQDNGTHQLNGPGLTSSVEVTGGDGAFVAIDQDQPQFQVGAYVFCNFRRSTNGGANWSGNGSANTQGQFINPFDYDNVNNKVYASYDAGQYVRWEDPQTGFTLTPVDVAGFNGIQVASVTVSPYTANRVYFGTEAGRVIQIDDAHTATPVETNITPAGMTGYVNSVVIGTSNQNLIATVTSTGTTNIWSTTNGGTSWVACDGNLPDIPVYWALFNPDNNTKAYIATETGVWSTDLLNGASTIWVPETTFPTVRTDMLKYRSSDRLIAAATHGRGIWTATLPAGCAAAAITTQPVSTGVCTLGNTTFTGAASGDGITYQWQVNAGGCTGATWTNISNGGVYSGATTGTLNITGATVALDGSAYRLVATGTCVPAAANSNCVALTVIAAATVTTQPVGTIVCANSTATFTAAGSGANPVYQWQVSTNGGTSWANVANTTPYLGTTTGTLTINPVAASLSNNMYRLEVSNTACSATANSNAGMLTVNALPNVKINTPDTSICTGTSLSLNATGADSYLWSTAAATQSVTVTPVATTTYTVTGANTITGCKNTATVAVVATPKPSLVLTASPYTRLLPGLTTTITATANSASTNNFIYTWAYTGTGPAQNFTGNKHPVTMSNLGTYTVTAADASNLTCKSRDTSIIITDSASSKLFIYPSPGNGQFNVAYYNPGGSATKQIVTIISSKGEKVYNKEVAVNQAYQIIDVDLRRHGAGVYFVILTDATGKKIKTGEVLIR